MSTAHVKKSVCVLVAVLASILTMAGCGGSDDASSSASTANAPAASSGGAGKVDVAAAEKVIAPFVGQPSEFPVTEPLKEVPRGAKVVYMDCGTSICAFFYSLLSDAAKRMGVQLDRIEAGTTADTIGPAYDTLLAKKPDAVISANLVELWNNQLKQLQQADIPIVTVGVTGAQAVGVKAPQAAENSSKLEGKLEANYILSKFGPDSKVVYYNVPELGFTVAIQNALKAELAKICPDCSLRTVAVPVRELGNTAANTVVSDLQAHPDDTVAVFGSTEVASGLPAALSAAGIKIKTLSQGPEQTTLQYLKDGKFDASLGVDFPILCWTLLDQAVRQINGQELSGPAAEGLTDYQFLTKDDITFDPKKGWTGYPDYAERFAKLWGVK